MSLADTVRGALVEELGAKNEDLHEFRYVPGSSYQGRYLFPKNGHQVHADIVVIAYTGEEKVFTSRNEVVGKGFEELESLQSNPENLRNGILPALQIISQDSFIPQFLEEIQNNRGKSVFLDPDKTAQQYFKERSEKSDLVNFN